MRALRDFNLPKIVTSDVPIFLGLISDLFPQLDVPRKRDPRLEDSVRQSVSELHLQPEENFILKVFDSSVKKPSDVFVFFYFNETKKNTVCRLYGMSFCLCTYLYDVHCS